MFLDIELFQLHLMVSLYCEDLELSPFFSDNKEFIDSFSVLDETCLTKEDKIDEDSW